MIYCRLFKSQYLHSVKILLGMPKSREKIDNRNRFVSDPDIRTLSSYD